MQQLEKEIIEWHIATFPQATLESQVLKWQEKFKELEQSNNYRAYLLKLCNCIIIATTFKRYGEAGKILSNIFNKGLLAILDKEKENWDLSSDTINRSVEFLFNKLKENNYD